MPSQFIRGLKTSINYFLLIGVYTSSFVCVFIIHNWLTSNKCVAKPCNYYMLEVSKQQMYTQCI